MALRLLQRLALGSQTQVRTILTAAENEQYWEDAMKASQFIMDETKEKEAAEFNDNVMPEHKKDVGDPLHGFLEKPIRVDKMQVRTFITTAEQNKLWHDARKYSEQVQREYEELRKSFEREEMPMYDPGPQIKFPATDPRRPPPPDYREPPYPMK